MHVNEVYRTHKLLVKPHKTAVKKIKYEELIQMVMDKN